jgi:hypothetical protein
MLYSEFLNGTSAPQNASTYDQYKEIEAIYMERESMTKVQAYRLWKRRYGEKPNKPRAKELREIKDAIREFKNNRDYVKAEAGEIAKGYEEGIAEYRARLKLDGNWRENYWENYWTMKEIERRENMRDKEIYDLYETYGNDATIHIIYTDGSECIASGTEIIAGEVTPKMQHIAYASYQDGWTEYDTLTGCLDDVWNLEEDEGFEVREQYFNSVEILFNTAWGRKHKAV